MKKKILLLMLLLIPMNLLAYSENIIVGGETIGIEAYSKGVVVVGFYKVNGKYIASETLKVGDTILEIEGVSVSSIKEMTSLIDKNIKNGKVNALIKRNNKTKKVVLNLVKDGSVYKTGLYIKEKVTGIGTLTYIDPETKIYGSLGHEIMISESTNRVEVRKGEIYKSFVNGIDRSINGRVGSKNASIDYQTELGTVTKNTSVGIYGIYNKTINKETTSVAKWEEINLGKAVIRTITDGSKIEEYEIEITSLNRNAIDTNKSITFKVTDKTLMEKTGGIVQGMSGSPIIQNGKIIGAVTHVVIDEVNKGYAVFIRTMLEEGER
ncbi:MAG: stage IV sporulation protein B [Tenericutes bacterium]|nr:stage IV sporulation protein B [Mycoplasmatota bacterium]